MMGKEIISTVKSQLSFPYRSNNQASRSGITLDSVSFHYTNSPFNIENIHLQISAGEIHFLTGESGAGKTTVLKLITGELFPQKGKIYKDKSLFISQVFQDLQLLNDYSGEENIRMSFDQSIWKTRHDFNFQMNSIRDILQISSVQLQTLVKDMNGGLKSKVAIIRALLSEPDILIMDEPTASLDLKSTNGIFELISLYNRKKEMTIIWATHDRDLVKKYPGKITHIHEGKIVYSGHACFI